MKSQHDAPGAAGQPPSPGRHVPAETIADYAAGLLPAGLSLLVASHLTFCPCCRRKAARLEALGGALLAGADAVAPAPRCLEAALARIEAAERAEPCFDAHGWPLPRPLCRHLARPIRELGFRAVTPALEIAPLDGFPGEAVEIRRAAAGARLFRADEDHGTALVLSGEAEVSGAPCQPGDCLPLPSPVAAGRAPCLCLAVRPA